MHRTWISKYSCSSPCLGPLSEASVQVQLRCCCCCITQTVKKKTKTKSAKKLSRTLDLNACWQFLRVNLLNSDSSFLPLKQLIYHRWGLCFGYTLKENLLLTKTVHQVLPDTLYFPPLSGHDFDICSCPIIGLEQLLTGFWKTVPLRKTLPHVKSFTHQKHQHKTLI